MSDDKSTKSPDTASNPSTSQPRQQEDFIASVRRFADEHISAALHSVFGIPSILQTPPSSNWMREEAERNRFENMNRREGSGGGDESRGNGNRDGDNGNNNGGSSGSGISGFGGGSGSSGQNPSSPSPSDTSSNKDRDDEIIFTITLPNVPMPPQVLLPEPLFNIGLRAIDSLDRNLSGHIEQLEKLIDEEMERQKEMSAARQRKDYGIFQSDFERLLDMEARVKEARASRQRDGITSETVIIKGTQINDGEPKISVTRHTGQQRSSILKELFGEDMYGAQRKHPLFTSLFDEFLPDGRYNEREEPPPDVVGGWKAHNQSNITPIFPLQENPFGQIFKMMMAPWIQKIYESSDPNRFDVRGRVMNRVKSDIWNDTREDKPSFEELQKLMHEERKKMAQERVRALVEKRKELEKVMKEHGEPDGKMDELLEGVAFSSPNLTERTKEQREPKTELELHDFVAGLADQEKTMPAGKKLISESTSTTATTGTDGITRVKKVRERRYSDGTMEREEHSEENTASFDPFMGRFRRFDSSKRRDASDSHPVIRAIEEHKKQSEAHPTKTQAPPAAVPESKNDEDSKNGGWGSWMWASGKKKD
ncbi:hypothetical protein TWF281_001858 [Arthrobotrys megalospora]